MEGPGKGRWGRRPDLHRPLPGRPFCPSALLNKAVSNVITSLVFGRRFEYDDPRFLKLLDLIQEGLKEESGLLREVRCRGGRRGQGVLGELSGRQAPALQAALGERNG